MTANPAIPPITAPATCPLVRPLEAEETKAFVEINAGAVEVGRPVG